MYCFILSLSPSIDSPSVECSISLGMGYAAYPRTRIKYSIMSPDIVVDNCAICRNHIMDLCASSIDLIPTSLKVHHYVGIDCQANQVSASTDECNAAWGICNVSYFYSMVFRFNAATPFATARIPFPLHLTLAQDAQCMSTR
jgi:hypothetical protein